MKEETTFDPANKASSPNARRTRWEQVMAKHKGAIDVEVAKAFEADRYDVIEKRDGPTERSLCGAVEDSPRGIPEWDWAPYFPGGTVQAKVVDTDGAGRLELWAAMGRPCHDRLQGRRVPHPAPRVRLDEGPAARHAERAVDAVRGGRDRTVEAGAAAELKFGPTTAAVRQRWRS